MNEWLERHAGPLTAGAFLLALLPLAATLTDPGITWDEPFYFGSAQRQVEWAESLFRNGPAAALDADTVFAAWDWEHYRNPHPPVYKTAMALTWAATRGLVGSVAGFRLAPALLFAALVATAFRWGAAAWSGVGGAGAALSILLMPRLFGHAHFGATETPLISFWFAATAAGWWAVERSRTAGWALAGIGWGLAAGTKFTGVIALVPLLLWGLWRSPRRTARGVPIAALAALATFWALNPMLWVDPARFLQPWLWESLHRGEYAPISTYYMGRAHAFSVPWHHVFVMTAAVTPLGILVLAGAGAIRGVRRRDPTVVLALGTVILVWGLMLLPRAPHHDGIRQFIVLFPFLGMVGGYGLHELWRATPDLRRKAATAAVVFVGAAAQVAWAHPYYLAYYGEAVGSVRGAHALGFETTYWMDAYAGPLLDWMNREIPPGSSVFVFGEPLPLEWQQAEGRLRRDIRFTSGVSSEYMLVQMRQGMMSEPLLRAVERTEPEYAVELQGVPLAAIYRVD